MTRNNRKRVLVGMSGGVDSAVSALLLKEAGYEVIGLTLTLWQDEGEDEKRWQDRSCCKLGLARHVAKRLGIPHHTMDVQSAFQGEVIDDFCETYLKGETPNPCIRCNERVKFSHLLKKAEALGADYLATGHYSRIRYRPETGRYALLKGASEKKDQSYFLYRLSQAQRARTLFPLGRMTKAAVYQKAADFDLPYEEILESQEVCFVTQKDYRAFLKENRPEALSPGEIVTTSGQVVGRHEGLAFYTLGQRKGLGVALGDRAYVTHLDVPSQRLVIGERTDLLRQTLIAKDIVWGGQGRPGQAIRVKARLRYRALEQDATLYPENNGVRLVFDGPQDGITPGQAVVFYQGDEVLGGGTILKKA